MTANNPSHHIYTPSHLPRRPVSYISCLEALDGTVALQVQMYRPPFILSIEAPYFSFMVSLLIAGVLC